MTIRASDIAHDLIEKTQWFYERVGRRFNMQRHDGPYDWLSDTGCIVPSCKLAFTNPADAMQQVAEFYRAALWALADVGFEIWVEKDAPDGYAPRSVNLLACPGFATLAFIHDLAVTIRHVNGYQNCGAADRIAEILAKLADEPILAQRLAVMPEQIATWPTRPARPPNHSRFQVPQASAPPSFPEWWLNDDSIDVSPPMERRESVRQAINTHLPSKEFEMLKIAKESERQVFMKWDPWKWRPC
jgi:hypothetical protein